MTVATHPRADEIERLSRLPHAGQFRGPWAIHPPEARALLAQFRSTNLHIHVEEHAGEEHHGDPDVSVAWVSPAGESRVLSMAAHRGAVKERAAAMKAGGADTGETTIALIRLEGAITKYGSSYSLGLTYFRRSLRTVARDKSIDAVLIVFDTPGGSVMGLEDARQEILKAREAKPVWGYCEDLCASAGLYLACACDTVFANKEALVGSIGCYSILEDWSQLYEEAGVKVYLVRAGEPFKGMGETGTVITEEHVAYEQSIVDAFNAQFLASIEQGRKLSAAQVRALNNGAIWFAPEAQKKGLIDGIHSLDSALAELSKFSRARSHGRAAGGRKEEKSMSVTLQELKTACPGASDSFLVSALEAGLSIEEAAKRFTQSLRESNDKLSADNKALTEKVSALEADNAKLKAQVDAKQPPAADAPAPKAKAPASPAAKFNEAEGTAGGASAQEEWDAKVAEQMKANGGDRGKAVRSVVAKHPELRERLVQEANAKA